MGHHQRHAPYRAAGALVGVLAALAALTLTPLAVLDAMPSLCLWRWLHLPCWGCGTVRALAALLHGDLERAWGYNHNIIVTVPALLGVILSSSISIIRTLKRPSRCA